MQELLLIINRSLSGFEDNIRKYAFWYLSGLSVLYFLVTIMRAAQKQFWYDELFTVYICQLPNLSAIWSATKAGADLNPPFLYIATRAFEAAIHNVHIAARMPGMVGFWAMSVSLLSFLKRRVPVTFAFAAMFFPLLTIYDYAYEARPYGLVLGFAGLALVCWQAAAENRMRWLCLPALSLCLALALLSHCYAIFLALPFTLGELVRTIVRRRLDPPMLVALAVSATPVVLYPSLFAASNKFVMGGQFTPSLLNTIGTYRSLLQGAVWALILSSILVITFLARQMKRDSAVSRNRLPLHELGVLVGFAAIPIPAVVLAVGYTHVYFVRYSLPMIIGVAALLVLLYAHASHASQRVGFGVLLIFATLPTPSLFHSSMDYLAHRKNLPLDSWNSNLVISTASKIALPLAISNGGHFLELNRYADDELISRMYYLTDSEAALRRTGTNVFEIGYPLLSRWFPIRGNIEDYGTFRQHCKDFLVYTDMNGRVEWLMAELSDSGADIRLVAQSGNDLLYEVKSQ